MVGRVQILRSMQCVSSDDNRHQKAGGWSLHILHSTFHVPHSIPHQNIPPSGFRLPLSTFHMSHVAFHRPHATFHMPHATFCMPHETCHMPHATCHSPNSTDIYHSTFHCVGITSVVRNHTECGMRNAEQRVHNTNRNVSGGK